MPMKNKWALLGVELDDQMLLDGQIDVLTGGHFGNSTLEGILFTLQPLGQHHHGGILAGQLAEFGSCLLYTSSHP